MTNMDLLTMAVTRNTADLEHSEVAIKDLMTKRPGSRLLDLSSADLFDIAGLEPYEAQRVLAAIELGRRLAVASESQPRQINSSKDAFAEFAFLRGRPTEEFHTCFLNTKNAVLSTRVMHIGTLNMTVVGAREVFREAIRENAASIIVAHNHPSGDPTPSPEDIAITKKLLEVGDLLDIRLLDHIIVGQNESVSLQEMGYIN